MPSATSAASCRRDRLAVRPLEHDVTAVAPPTAGAIDPPSFSQSCAVSFAGSPRPDEDDPVEIGAGGRQELQRFQRRPLELRRRRRAGEAAARRRVERRRAAPELQVLVRQAAPRSRNPARQALRI